jgi:hypothetical protein
MPREPGGLLRHRRTASAARRFDSGEGPCGLSLEPMDCTREIVDAAAHSPRIAAHFHLPLQHGSDAMLAAMKRPYTAGDYRALVDEIHALGRALAQ